MDLTCIYTTVRNDSGKTRKFAFLPPHGVTLTAGQQFSVVGDLVDAVSRGSRFGSESRNIKALEYAINAGDLVVVHTPAPILEDSGRNVSKMVRLQNGNLVVSNPCYTSESA